jgi:D-glycero-alpha-D-manno-heptose-7-phosphate kinase
MIITRTPFRVTLGGGGTDLPSYYSKFGGFLFSAAINKYMYINVNSPVVDDLVRVKYSKSETVAHRDLLEHDLAREALRIVGIERGIEITSMADVPAGTGLGSSSCYAVGLLNALHTLQRQPIGYQELAEEACHLEIEILQKPIGKQDQYMAAFGGLTVMEIDNRGKVKVSSANVPHSVLEDLQRNMLLFYTGVERSADGILSEQSKATLQGQTSVLDSLHRIKEMGFRIREHIEQGDLTSFGLELDRHWQVKKKLSVNISNGHFDKLYELAKENGALGGKISGAGGGGFLLLYVEEKHGQLRRALHAAGLREMRYRFDSEGTKVLVNLADGSI